MGECVAVYGPDQYSLAPILRPCQHFSSPIRLTGRVPLPRTRERARAPSFGFKGSDGSPVAQFRARAPPSGPPQSRPPPAGPSISNPARLVQPYRAPSFRPFFGAKGWDSTTLNNRLSTHHDRRVPHVPRIWGRGILRTPTNHIQLSKTFPRPVLLPVFWSKRVG